MKFNLVLACLLGLVLQAQGQILEIPLPSNPTLKAASKRYQPVQNSNKNGAGDTLNLPFLDDFSYDGVYPSAAFWEDRDAYVNRGYGIRPPTTGVATLDGLAFNGTPHGSGSGIADYLTSKPFYLGGFTASNNIYLSFFYQPRGFGDRPEAGDSLFVEFKNTVGNWVRVRSIQGLPSSAPADSIPPFQQISIPINSTNYLFDGFQFRIGNYATLTGSVDHWHIDYVRITQNSIPSLELNDVAFTRQPRPILKNYTSMPWRHYRNDKIAETDGAYRLDLINHFSTQKNINPSEVLIREVVTNTILLQDNILSFNTPPIPLGNMPFGQHLTVDTNYTTVQSTTLLNNLDGFDALEKLRVHTFFLVSPTGQDGTVPLTLRNDTVMIETVFDNYFAYDDGEAELSIVGGRIGDQVAVKFHANVTDTLRAMQLYIPRINGDVSGQRFNLRVWVGDLNTTPVYVADFVQPIYVDSLSGWTTYSLDTTPVELPVGDFYIGWQQAIDPPSPSRAIPVGYDRSSPDKVQFNFKNVGNGWEPMNSTNTAINDGAVMIRAIVGSETPFTTATETPKTTDFAKVYPNPARDFLTIALNQGDFYNYEYRLFNTLGQQVKRGELVQQIGLNELNSGWYVLFISEKNTNLAQRIKFLKIK